MARPIETSVDGNGTGIEVARHWKNEARIEHNATVLLSRLPAEPEATILMNI